MRTLRVALLLAAMAVSGSAAQLPGSPGQAQPTQNPPAGAVTGVVIDATTGQPVAGAVVSLARLDGGAPIPRSVTDSKGRFIFRQLEPSDQYFLGARRFGYEYTRYGWSGPNQTLATADIARIAVAKDQWIQDIKIPLWRLGSISGRVLDEHNEPLVGVAVRVFSQGVISGQRQLVAGDVATTDDTGHYRVSGLQPGTYAVAVLSPQSTVLQTTPEFAQTQPVGELAGSGVGVGRGGVYMPTIDVDGKHRLAMSNYATPPPPASGEGRAYPLTFYPGVANPSDASPVEIRWSSANTAIDIHVRPVPAVKVSGRLVAPDGDPPRQLLLRLVNVGMERLGFGTEVATTIVEDDGSFTFLNVPAGSYSLLAQASVTEYSTGSMSRRVLESPGFTGVSAGIGSTDGAPGLEYLTRASKHTDFWARMPVSVGQRDMTDVAVPLRHTATIHGRIALSEGLSLPPEARFRIGLDPANGDVTLGSPSGSADNTKPDRSFTIAGLLGGPYLLTAGISIGLPTALPATRVASVTWQGREIRDTGFDASTVQDFNDVIVTLTDKTIAVTGKVVGSSGPLIAAVIAFPADPARWINFGLHPPIFEVTRSGTSGAYRLDRLVEGDYYFVAVDPSQRDEWVNLPFLTAAATQASRVSLKWGDKQTVNLSMSQVVIK